MERSTLHIFSDRYPVVERSTNPPYFFFERRTLHIFLLLKVDPTSLGVASAGSGVELGLADPASLAWEDNLVATALNLSTPEIRCFSPKKVT